MHEAAARNNAIWCNRVCCAHGVPGEITATHWINRNPVPRFHSNMVTTAGPEHAEEQLAALRGLLDDPPSGSWGIKDSWACLDLADLGFNVLFEASWIAADPLTEELPPDSGLSWQMVRTPDQLDAWQQAWDGEEAHQDSERPPRQFPPALMDDPDHAFFAGYQGQEVRAVAIANRTGDVVGVSNVFTSSDLQLWPGVRAAVSAQFPGLPLVGYERGDDLQAALTAGFREVHRLRVWAR